MTPQLTDNSWTANGHKYLVHSPADLPPVRFQKFEELQLWAEYGVSPSAFRAEVTKAFEALQKPANATAAVLLNNILEGVVRIENGQPHPILQLCALFICREGESLTRPVTDAEANEKIADWNAEGIPVAFFLALLRRSGSSFTESYDDASLTTSAPETTDETAGDRLVEMRTDTSKSRPTT